MNKLFFSIFIVILGITFAGCGINANSASHNLTTYSINATLNTITYSLDCNMQVDYFNHTQTELEEIHFNLYPNAFSKDNTQEVVSTANFAKCFYNGKSYGKIDIKKVSFGDKTLAFAINGIDKNILVVSLENALMPENCIRINIEFKVELPNANHRFGYGENTINLGNFFPIACVYEDGKWQEMRYYANGDPFYSECSNFNVTLAYPSQYIVASTGIEVQNNTNGDLKNSTFEAKSVRDFAIVLSKNFKILSEKIGSTIVSYYYYSDQYPEQSFKTAKLAMQTFNKSFGDYPYEEIKVVEANFVHGGMEYPNIVLISDDIQDYDTYQYCIVHELAHQWWYGVVGNNQFEDAWLDEGLTEYSSALFYKLNATEGYNFTQEYLVEKANSSFNTFKAIYGNTLGEFNTAIDRNLQEFTTEPEYYYMVYVRGFLLFQTLDDMLGEKLVLKTLKTYYKDNAFKIATPESLIGCFQKSAKTDLETYFNTWLKGNIIEF